MSVGYTQRALWPEFDADYQETTSTKHFTEELLSYLGLAQSYESSTKLKSFSDGSVCLDITVMLSPEEVSLAHK